MLKIGAVVWGVRDIPRAVRFWSEALHYKLREPASEDWAVLIPIEGEGMQLSLSQVASPHARRHHIDLFADQPEQEVERLLALGATRKAWRCPEGADYVLLQAPDGNPFCVVARGAGAVSCGCPPQAQGR